MQILIDLLLKFWKPVSLFLGGFATYGKGYYDRWKAEKHKKIVSELEAHKRLKNVKTNTDRDAALQRLRKSGHVRKD
jgi:hypothetical protein